VVDDLDDGGEATGIRALLEEDNAADLDILPVGSTDFRSHREEVSDCKWRDVIVSLSDSKDCTTCDVVFIVGCAIEEWNRRGRVPGNWSTKVSSLLLLWLPVTIQGSRFRMLGLRFGALEISPRTEP
jgi:hypothetical protein